MKILLTILILGCSVLQARSQSIFELTEQLAIDGEQLAVMRSTLKELVQGYDQLKSGFTHIRDIVKDNFNLHKTFLDAQWILSPAVHALPQMTSIVNTTQRIMTGYRSGNTTFANNPVFTTQELSYITGTQSALLTRCNQHLEEFAMVSTDNTLRMTDDQRIDVLTRIDAELKAEYAFLQQFNDTLALEAARRRKESGDLHTLKLLYGLPD